MKTHNILKASVTTAIGRYPRVKETATCCQQLITSSRHALHNIFTSNFYFLTSGSSAEITFPEFFVAEYIKIS